MAPWTLSLEAALNMLRLLESLLQALMRLSGRLVSLMAVYWFRKRALEQLVAGTDLSVDGGEVTRQQKHCRRANLHTQEMLAP